MNKPRLLLAFSVLALIALLTIAWPVSAADNSHGWTIWQDGKSFNYPFKDQWTGSSNKAGYTMTNTKQGLEHYYYGNFRVEFRQRDR
ncbi:MAG: hypothetical protein ACYTGN_10395 [Planctomycetota bacterium]|jgi:hypothetical protein